MLAAQAPTFTQSLKCSPPTFGLYLFIPVLYIGFAAQKRVHTDYLPRVQYMLLNT